MQKKEKRIIWEAKDKYLIGALIDESQKINIAVPEEE